MNTAKLKSIMILHGETQKQLAKVIGVATSGLNSRINGKKPFRQNEMDAIRKHYSLDANDMEAIFFANEVS